MVVVNPDNGEVVVAGRYLDRIILVLPSVVQVLLATVEGNPASGQGVAVAVDGGEGVGEVVFLGDESQTHQVVAAFTLATPVVADGIRAVVRHLEVGHGEGDGLVGDGVGVGDTAVVGDIHAAAAAVVDSRTREPSVGAGTLVDGEEIGCVLEVVDVRQVVRVGGKGGGGGGDIVAHALSTVGVDPYIVGGETRKAVEGVVCGGSGAGEECRGGVILSTDFDSIAATVGCIGP